ncbi:uncharacterized protein [Nothobranchius furzeri]|uniref:uncharacterized protein n=1 Tax=Nothobranchius furzeri TaxID=105023 RepID=UPI0039049586
METRTCQEGLVKRSSNSGSEPQHVSGPVEENPPANISSDGSVSAVVGHHYMLRHVEESVMFLSRESHSTCLNSLFY